MLPAMVRGVLLIPLIALVAIALVAVDVLLLVLGGAPGVGRRILVPMVSDWWTAMTSDCRSTAPDDTW